MALKPSLTQLSCKEAYDPISFFHLSLHKEVVRGFPSAISEYKESDCLLTTMNLSCCPIFIPSTLAPQSITFILTNSLQGRLTPSYRRSSRLVSILHLNIQDVPCNRERRLVWNPSGGLPIHLHQT